MGLIERLRAFINDDWATPRPKTQALMREAADKLEELLRWKSTHAPRIEALEGLLAAAQQEAAAGREAVTSLASERAANELLTNEVERLRAAATELVAAERDCRTCRHFRFTQRCHSVLRCVEGSSYQRVGVVHLWEAAPVQRTVRPDGRRGNR